MFLLRKIMFKIVFGGKSYLLFEWLLEFVIDPCFLFFFLNVELSVLELAKTVHFLPLNVPRKLNDV